MPDGTTLRVPITAAAEAARAPTPRAAAAAPEVRIDVPELLLGGQLLFRDFSLSLDAGRTTCLLGPSGVGKSTLLRLVAGLLPGAQVSGDRVPGLAGRVALMAQSDLLLPWLSTLDNALLGHRLRGVPRSQAASLREQAQHLLADLGLGGRLVDLPATLSGGMRQRVALARTLMEERPVVLMDEPFSALDAVTRHRLQDLAARLLTGRTVLLVTHSPLEALRLGHRIHILGGPPVQVRGSLSPPGPPPRDPRDPALLALQGELFDRLVASAAQREDETA